jgi:23S rRNA pseudouridine1911/1915/1917 synthase
LRSALKRRQKITPQNQSNNFTADTGYPRLDKYLTIQFPGLSRSQLQQIIRQGNVLVNAAAARASQPVLQGDTITVFMSPPEPIEPGPEPIPLDVVYDDKDIIVINKPAGLTVHPAPGHTGHTLVNALLSRYPEIAHTGEPDRPGIVHRLDKDTSGLMLIARNNEAYRNLISQFKSHTVNKSYLVLVKGKLETKYGIIEAPIGRDPENRQRMAVVEEGKEAKTTFRVKEYYDSYTLLDIKLDTGRTHQIRVHMAAIGYPVVGDTVYGVKSIYTNRQFVHAYKLGFHLPSGNNYREFTCELPDDLKSTLKRLENK